MIDSVGYIIVTIELPSPRAFASILIYIAVHPAAMHWWARRIHLRPLSKATAGVVRAGSSPSDERDSRHFPPMTFWRGTAYKEREIPIPAKLVKGLKVWKVKSDKTCGLVFPTAGCKPKLDFLDCLKSVAERANLNPGNFWLHKFRSTFATRCLWANVDLRTVQQWLGHSDMESTMRYLKPSRSQQVREKVNQIFF
jgi:integrase